MSWKTVIRQDFAIWLLCFCVLSFFAQSIFALFCTTGYNSHGKEQFGMEGFVFHRKFYTFLFYLIVLQIPPMFRPYLSISHDNQNRACSCGLLSEPLIRTFCSRMTSLSFSLRRSSNSPLHIFDTVLSRRKESVLV